MAVAVRQTTAVAVYRNVGGIVQTAAATMPAAKEIAVQKAGRRREDEVERGPVTDCLWQFPFHAHFFAVPLSHFYIRACVY
jgi:hypothetical protein